MIPFAYDALPEFWQAVTWLPVVAFYVCCFEFFAASWSLER